MGAFDVFVQHGFKMEHFVAKSAWNRLVFVMVFHVLNQHTFGVEFSVAQVALKVGGSVDFLVFREVAGIAEGFIAESALVYG